MTETETAAGASRAGIAARTSDSVNLDQIIDNSYDSIFVTDKFGNVLLANPAAHRLLQVEPEELIGANVNDLVKRGIYTRSTALEAARKRSVVTGLIKNRFGLTLMSTSMPLIGEDGEVSIVVTNTREKDLIEKYIAALEEERAKADRYKTAVEYLGELDLDSKMPVAESPVMRKIMAGVNVVARVDNTVLLQGESGSGKEVIARYIHWASPRAKEPFIPVNCAAVPHELLESEFFGYLRGAFTGANPQGKPGLFEIADKGTLFLDEISELPLLMQSKLLRVLETGEVQRLGATTALRSNMRVIAATNKDLKQLVGQNLFRDDLYYRLNVLPINLPPLRERPEDIVALAEKFLAEHNKKYGLRKTFLASTIQAFLDYDWPGNVRELRNVIERLAITSPGEELEFEAESGTGAKARADYRAAPMVSVNYTGCLKEVLKLVERQYIEQVLQECNGRVGETAKRLGIHRTLLYRKIRQVIPKAERWVAK
jgi:transcriptional regulator with PAS, ATPase and Fis domain